MGFTLNPRTRSCFGYVWERDLGHVRRRRVVVLGVLVSVVELCRVLGLVSGGRAEVAVVSFSVLRRRPLVRLFLDRAPRQGRPSAAGFAGRLRRSLTRRAIEKDLACIGSAARVWRSGFSWVRAWGCGLVVCGRVGASWVPMAVGGTL